MNPWYGRIGSILIVTIFAGGILVAFLGYSSTSSGPSTVTYGGSGATITLTSSGYNFGNAESSTITATQTMTATTLATSIYVPDSSSTITLNAGQETGTTAAQQPRGLTASDNSRFIEFSSNVSLRVSSPASALDKASAVAYSLGGYVAYSTLRNTTAFVVLRVPSQNYQGALSQVESLGTVLGAGSTSNDVTVRYTDLNATLLSLTSEQTSLLKLLNQSADINSTLKIESILQQVNAQVNEVQSEILQTQRLISYGTISVSLEKVAPAPTPTKPITMKLTATPKSGMSPLSVTFNAIVGGGSAPYIVNYNFGDGSSSQGQTLIHTFGQPGEFNVTVTATDSTGNVSEAWTAMHVLSPPIDSSFVSFPAYVGGLFLQVVEGIIEVAVVVLPIAGVAALVILPLRRKLGNHHQQNKSRPQSVDIEEKG